MKYWFLSTLVVVSVGYAIYIWARVRMSVEVLDRLTRKSIWTAIRSQGGGSVSSPREMTEGQAMMWVATMGSVMYVDREHHFIFYRPQ